MREVWPSPTPLRVRIAVHTGAADVREGDYYGSDVNRCARLRAIAYGGQTLISGRTAELLGEALPEGATLRGLGQHRLKDLGQPERVYQLMHPDLATEFPPLRSLSTFLNNLPFQATSFVGRERELREIEALLHTTRLLTLVGTGGAGKTRLALHVAADVVDDFDDGVWLTELAPLTDGPRIAQALASAIGVREEPGHLLLDSVLAVLRRKQSLVVFDNCEHLITACAQLIDTILRTCPHVRVLATSREALGIAGETVWRVPSLSLPENHSHASSLGDLTQSEAVRLFLERAAAARPGFSVTERNLPALLEICRRLDGIPLALELAAARVRVLTFEQIALRLADRFGLLTGGSRAAATRQKALRATVDWSYDLLSESEQAFFSRLSVFAGGLDLEAAESVCAGDGESADSVLDLLTQLVEKSLVVAEPQPDGVMRYRLLETLRQYGQKRLRASGDVATRVSTRHASHYLLFAQRAEPELTGRRQGEWLTRLEVELDNLRAAVTWASDAGESEIGLHLAGSLWRFWSMRGYLSEGREQLGKVLASSVDATSESVLAARSLALHGAGTLASQQADFTAARTLLEASLAIRRATRDRRGMANTLNNLGIVARLQGELGLARDRFEESLELQRELGSSPGIANCLNNLALVAQGLGDFVAARAFLEDGLAMSREMGDRWAIANRLTSLAEVALDAGDFAPVSALLEESLTIKG